MTERTFEEQVQLSSLSNIKTDGITIRVGNQIVKFVASETQDILVEDEVKNELREGYNAEVEKLKEQYNTLVRSTKDQAKQRTRELDRREEELNRKAREIVALPVLNDKHVRQGLTVSKQSGSGYLWSYICVYAPKYVNNKVIDPNFAKRLMTPIRIFVYTDDNWKVTNVKLVKLINCDKFEHYHSMSSGRDCWGGMKFSGEIVDTPDKALKFLKDVQIVLETVNRMSIANRSPKGLSRLATLENHLLNDRPDPQNNKRETTASRRNERAGFDENVNEEVTGALWDATGA